MKVRAKASPSSKLSFPLAKPIIATIGLFIGIAYWNDWNNGYIYLAKRTELYSIQNLLNRIVQSIQYLTQSGDANAAALMAKMPTVSVPWPWPLPACCRF